MTTAFAPAYRLLGITVLLVVLYFSRTVVLASLVGVGVGVLISPLLDRVQQQLGLRRSLAAVLLILAALVLMAILAALFSWGIVDQANLLAERLPDLIERLRTQLVSLLERFPWVRQRIETVNAAGALQQVAQFLFAGAQSGVVAIGGVIFALIIGIYLAVDSESYFKGTVRAFPPRHRERAESVLIKCANVVRVWFRAQLIDMAIIGAITTVGLFLVGVNYWALFGLLTALFGIIPYVGVLIVVVIVSLLTLASDPGQVPWVLLVFFITQQIEGNVVLPLVMKGQAEIPEALLIVIMLFFGSWFGLLGVFIAPPLVAVMICLYRNLYLPAIEPQPQVIARGGGG
jgi:predicted PurR-regulated permease PerM